MSLTFEQNLEPKVHIPDYENIKPFEILKVKEEEECIKFDRLYGVTYGGEAITKYIYKYRSERLTFVIELQESDMGDYDITRETVEGEFALVKNEDPYKSTLLLKKIWKSINQDKGENYVQKFKFEHLDFAYSLSDLLSLRRFLISNIRLVNNEAEANLSKQDILDKPYPTLGELFLQTVGNLEHKNSGILNDPAFKDQVDVLKSQVEKNRDLQSKALGIKSRRLRTRQILRKVFQAELGRWSMFGIAEVSARLDTSLNNSTTLNFYYPLE